LSILSGDYYNMESNGKGKELP